MVAEGKIPAPVKIGRRSLFKLAELRAAVKEMA